MKEMSNTYLPYKLQFFAEEADTTDVEETEDNTEEVEETKEEKTLTQAEVDKAIEKRLAREKKKWLKEQTEVKDDNKGQADPENPKLKEAEEKATLLETKMLVYEAGVTKDSVDDVIALARAYANDDTDIEEAIEKVLEKYPQFKGTPKEAEKQSWGTRQKSNTPKPLESMTYDEYKAYRKGK